MRRTVVAAIAAVCCAGAPVHARFPERTITLVVPYSAGGPADTIARPVAHHLSQTLGQQVVIENVTGAGGTLGTARVAKAAPDGYTLLIHNLGLAAAPQFFKALSYDTETSLAPIGLINSGPMVLVGRKTLAANSAADLWRLLKEEGLKINMAHAGLGANSHLCGILLNRALGVEVTFVPYKGTGPAMNDLLGGQVDLVCDQSTTAVPQIAGGMVKGFVVTSDQRLDSLPDLPTSREANLAAFGMGIWHGLYAPANTSADVIDRLNAALQLALADAAMLERFKQAGTAPFPLSERSPDSHRRRLKEEIERWAKVIGKTPGN